MTGPSHTRLQLIPIGSACDIPPEQWDRFASRDNPFLRHAFFHALETTGCTTRATGWEPAHLSVELDGEAVGLVPAFRKYHSMGEYVFDWAWADAWQRYGLPYYPKLLMAVPFTPSTGRRLLLSPEARGRIQPAALHDALNDVAQELGCHSWHLLFPNAEDQPLLGRDTGLRRIGCQFHWFNHGYDTFEDFLATLTSRKRKSIRKERRRIAEQGITFQRFSGHDLPDDALEAFYLFYSATYLKRGQRPYLNQAFFQALRANQPEQLHVVMAVRDDRYVAAALFLAGDTTLYGRYWGCLEEYDQLHFETCYYQGIDLAIDKGLTGFDAGAQGEHKLVRGFEPVITRSWHWVAHEGFREAVERFTEEEAEDVLAYRDAALEALPFRKTEP
ncbi:hypothetical protein C8D92_10642 [Tamilnaduibacter salinus]|uniref:GNAT family N-acetyltransferase n=1 Tax=Tamilnaduibacter salinus TaxID=1484056 RepID=A0A2A2I197_9GAMM|nr:GNAT family N-acetyltransferase [Tamilnaduibacter salinus]PAV25801.1 GNAT family N-acetyltransferase [Tamilnaduibacter salinus]PVY75782.1 hypothetical protein C8D92_10642 [Tamilnaduibacter salinus]